MNNHTRRKPSGGRTRSAARPCPARPRGSARAGPPGSDPRAPRWPAPRRRAPLHAFLYSCALICRRPPNPARKSISKYPEASSGVGSVVIHSMSFICICFLLYSVSLSSSYKRRKENGCGIVYKKTEKRRI